MAMQDIRYSSILSVDIQSEGSFGQLVFPMWQSLGSTANPNRQCYNLVQAFKAGALANLQACIVELASITGVGATGIVAGTQIPYRENYALDTYPGSRLDPDEDPEPSSVGVIIDWYPDANDVDDGTRIPVAHNSIFGIAESDTGGNVIVDALRILIDAFAVSFLDGTIFYNDAGGGGDSLTWKRLMSRAKSSGDWAVREAISFIVKTIVGTQSRRLRPPRR